MCSQVPKSRQEEKGRLGLDGQPQDQSLGGILDLSSQIDRHNFETLPPGTPLGWLRDGAPWPLEAIGQDGEDHSHALFAREGGMLTARRELVPIMMTTDVEIALSDCLFYAVRRTGGRILPGSPTDG